jgi:hypothetical protein
MDRVKAVFGLLFGIIVVEIALRFYALDKINTAGIALYEKQQAVDLVKRANAHLKEQILIETSLTVVASKAAGMGMGKATHIYLPKR